MNNLKIMTYKYDDEWRWYIDSDTLYLESRVNYKRRKDAKFAALEFINRCMTDRYSWPPEYK